MFINYKKMKIKVRHILINENILFSWIVYFIEN